ncbi:MAG: hypothetical protein ACKVWV_01080 [Planctomycetota bacterium]
MQRTDAGDDLLEDAFAALASMHVEAVSRRNGDRAGLTDFAYHAAYTGERYEIPSYGELRAHLSERGWSAECDVRYADSLQECDLVVRLGDASIWREWPSSVSRRIEIRENVGDILSMKCSHSLARDCIELEAVRRDRATHLDVVALAFDADHQRLDAVIERMEREQRLVERGWSRAAPRALVDWNSASQRVVLRGWRKRLAVADPAART